MTKNFDWKEVAGQCDYRFPESHDIEKYEDDLVSIGADLKPATLINAYSNGYFPMEVDDENRHRVLAWFSPVNRGIIPLENLRVTKSMNKSAKKYTTSIDKCFEDVMRSCMNTKRKGGWITEDFIASYVQLYEMGFAHSVEVFEEGYLVGGLYGVAIGGFFAGESMFSAKRDASKVALMHLVDHMRSQNATLLDTQWLTDHLSTLGAIEIPRAEYIRRLSEAIVRPSIKW